MAKYLVKASYSVEGVQGLVKEGGSARVEAVRAAIEGVGGKLETFYFSFGDTDAYIIAEMPSNTAAAALAAAVGATGKIGGYQTITLLTPEELDKATEMTVSYRPPGA